jgi:tetratricopeptide (TPR) repeat protein
MVSDMGERIQGKNLLAFALLFFLIFLIYSNTFQASWHLDDYPNIVQNPHVQITDLQPGSIIQTFFAARDAGLYLGENLYRPVACLTLALNWYFGKDAVFGYHAGNITIHFLTAFILFLTILNLLNTPRVKSKFGRNRYFIALLTATLWAINPIQTQAVTYIVQRMASLATMFYILGLYLYLRGRISNSTAKRILLYSGCFFSYLLAIGSKENAATMPVAIFFLEIIFYQDLSLPKVRRIFIWGTVICGVTILLAGFGLFYRGSFSSVLAGYNARFFSPLERLMTEPRILIFYITQIFYPIPSRLSIQHDIITSTSLFQPWMTLPAILVIFILLGIAIVKLKKWPIVSFSILFFFLNHLIESTIIPLELVFEHRNYLPSLFLFFPVSVGILWIFDHYREKKRAMYTIFVSSVILLIIGFGAGTYIRNMAWITEKSLWEDAMKKAPGNARPVQNLAWGYYVKIGDYDNALKLYKKAFKLHDTNPVYSEILSLTNMADIYLHQQEYEKAIELCNQALDVYPNYLAALKVLTLALLKVGKLEEASQNAELLFSKHYTNTEYMFIAAFSLMKVGKYEAALNYLRKVIRTEPHNKKILYNIGVALSLMGKYERAELFLNWAHQIAPGDIIISFYLIENSLKAGDQAGVDRYLDRLLLTNSIKAITTYGKGLPEGVLKISFSPELIEPLIIKKIEEKLTQIEALTENS